MTTTTGIVRMPCAWKLAVWRVSAAPAAAYTVWRMREKRTARRLLRGH